MRIGIIGGGRWGATLAALLCRLHNVTLFCLQSDLERITASRLIPTTDIALDPRVRLSINKAELLDCEVVFLAVSGEYLESAWHEWESFVRGTLVVAVKTIGEKDGHLVFPLDLIDCDRKAFFGCAGFPQELLAGDPSLATAYSTSDEVAKEIQGLFGPPLRVYRSKDVIGGQFVSATKNVVATAVGIARGMGFGDMTTSTVINRGQAEVCALGVKLGADPRTFAFGTAVSTDLTGTCISHHSHNVTHGIQLARHFLHGDPFALAGTAEGPRTVRMLAKCGYLPELPICEAVYNIICGEDPRVAMTKLLGRPLKCE